MFKSFKEQKELKKKRKAEGKVVELPNKDEVLEVSTEPVDTKIEKENKNSFEEFKVLYKGQIDDKCLEDYGTIEDKKLWEDTAKELFMASEDYIPDENNKAEKIEEGKKLNEDHQLYYDDIQGMPTSERHLLWKQYHEEDFEDTEEGNDKFWDWAEEEFPVKEIEESKKLNEKDLGNNTYTDIDEAEYYRNKELYYHNQLARYKDAMEKARRACKKKGIKLKEESKSERYQVREFDGSGAKFGVFDTKEKKFVQKGSKYIMDAACKDLNEKGKVTESSIIKYTLKEMMNKKQEAEEGASIFELKFDCSNEDTFGIGQEMINPIADTLRGVIEKIEIGRFDGPIMDVNGNKIGSFGIGYEGVQSGLSESKKVEESVREDLIQLRKDNKGLYDYVANNYSKMSQEELKEIALDAIYVANNDSQIINELTDRYDKDEQEEYAYEIQEFSKKPYDFIANNYNNLTTEFLKEIALNAIYVADNDSKIIDEYTERMDESVDGDIEKAKKDSIKKGLYCEARENDVKKRIKQAKEWKKKVKEAVEAEDLENIVDEILENISSISDINYAAEDLQSSMESVLDDQDAYDVGPVTYVKSVKLNMRDSLDSFIENYEEAFEEESLEESKKEEAVEEELNVTDGNEDINSIIVTYISNQTFMKYYNLEKPITEDEVKNIRLKIKNHEMYVTDIKDKLGATEVNSRKELIPNTYVMKIKENDIEDLEESKQDKCVICGSDNLNGCFVLKSKNICKKCGKKYSLEEIEDKLKAKDIKTESQVSDYTFKELNKVINDKGNDFKIQISGSEDKTNWLNIDKEDLQAIYQALQNKKAK